MTRSGERVEHPVGLAAFDFVHLRRLVADDLGLDRIDVAARQVREQVGVVGFPARVALVGEAAAGVGRDDLVGTGRGRRVRSLVFVRRAGWDGGDEWHRQLVDEGAARGFELDGDLATRVVGFDPGDAFRVAFEEVFGADDGAVEGRSARFDLEEAFDRRFEVRGPDRRPVGVFKPVAQGQRVGLSVVADLRQALGESGDHFRALLAFGVRVGEQRDVRVVHRRPAFGRVGELRVEVVGEGGEADRQRAPFLAARVAAGGKAQGDHRHPKSRQHCAELPHVKASDLDWTEPPRELTPP